MIRHLHDDDDPGNYEKKIGNVIHNQTSCPLINPMKIVANY